MNNYNPISSKKTTGKEVSKQNPCPICQKTDWCFWIDENIIACNRSNRGTRIDGWVEYAKTKDGNPIFKDEESYLLYREKLLSSKSQTKREKKPKSVHPIVKKQVESFCQVKIRQSKAIEVIGNFKCIPKNIAKEIEVFDPNFPVFSSESPVWQKIKEDKTGIEKVLHYRYTENFRVVRKQWSDRRSVYTSKGKGNPRSKMVYPQSRANQNDPFSNGKSQSSSGLYKEYQLVQELPETGGVLWLVGGEQAVEAARALGLAATCTQGGEGKNLQDLAKFIDKTRNAIGERLVELLAIVPDLDIPGITAATRTINEIQERFPSLPIVMINPVDLWAEMPVKGDIADWVSSLYLRANMDSKGDFNMEREAILRALKNAVQSTNFDKEPKPQPEAQPEAQSEPQPQLEPEPEFETKPKFQLGKSPTIEEMIEFFIERLNGKFLYVPKEKVWYKYEASKPGCWERIGKELFHYEIVQIIKEGGTYPNYRRIGRVEQELCGYLHAKEKMDALPPHQIAMKNGIFDLNEKKLFSHSHVHQITQTLDYDYNPAARCPKIEHWLQQMTGESTIKQNILLAFAAASLRKMGRLQLYLELTGAPGTGKGTWLRLMTAFLGQNNTCATTLKSLENRFELQRLQFARFAQITDAHEYGGDPAILKAITGMDLLRVEHKNKDYEADDFYFEGIVAIAANYTPQFSSGQEALSRRRVPVLLNRPVKPNDAEDLIEPCEKGWIGKFANELPGFFNLIANIPEEAIVDTLRDKNRLYEEYKSSKREIILDTDPLAQWVDEYLYYDPTIDPKTGLPKLKTQVGVAQKDDSSGNFKNFDSFLYASYRQWLTENGHTKWISTRNFSFQLESLLKQTLEYKESFHKRIPQGSFFFGIGFRADLETPDSEPLMVSESEPSKERKPIRSIVNFPSIPYPPTEVALSQIDSSLDSSLKPVESSSVQSKSISPTELAPKKIDELIATKNMR